MLKNQRLATIGMVLGGIALLIAVVHFWAGPFNPSPPIEQVVADKVVAIRDLTLAKLQGKKLPPMDAASKWDADRITLVTSSVLGTLAIILSAFAFSRRENIRACYSAAALGVAAIAFQFVIMALGLIIIIAVFASFFS